MGAEGSYEENVWEGGGSTTECGGKDAGQASAGHSAMLGVGLVTRGSVEGVGGLGFAAGVKAVQQSFKLTFQYILGQMR